MLLAIYPITVITTIHDSIKTLVSALQAINPEKYVGIGIPLTGIKEFCCLGAILANQGEILKAIQSLVFPSNGTTPFLTTGEKSVVIDYIVKRGKLPYGKMNTHQWDSYVTEGIHAKGNGVKALGEKHNNDILKSYGDTLLAAKPSHQNVRAWCKEGAKALDEDINGRKTHDTAHGRIRKHDPNFTDEWAKMFIEMEDTILGKGNRFPRHRRFNADEMGLKTNPNDSNSLQVDYKSNGSTQITRALDGDKHSVYKTSLMVVSCADPNVPSFFSVLWDNPSSETTFPALNSMNHDVRLRGLATVNGLMTVPAFRVFCHDFIRQTKTTKENLCVLQLDAYFSHLDHDSLTFLNSHGCEVVFGVSKATMVGQPMIPTLTKD